VVDCSAQQYQQLHHRAYGSVCYFADYLYLKYKKNFIKGLMVYFLVV